MYATCLFCHAALGRNAAVEHFPVGRRLAYDAARGRLWVVCPRCARWNLTPLEERWEAIEDAERLFRAARTRVSTGTIGLARVADGTELVRIGAPLRAEFSAWRYGDQFGRRRRRVYLASSLVIAWTAAAVTGGAVGVAFTAASPMLALGAFVHSAWRWRRGRVRLPVADGQAPLVVNPDHLGTARLLPAEYGGFALEIPGLQQIDGRSWEVAWRFDGVEAIDAAARLLVPLNAAGGTSRDVAAASALLDEAGSAATVFWRVARSPAPATGWVLGPPSEAGTLGALDPVRRLALEMAAHEEAERRAMAGALDELARAWQRAEEIAAIADDLLLPPALADRLAQLRGRSTARAGAASSPSSESGSESNS